MNFLKVALATLWLISVPANGMQQPAAGVPANPAAGVPANQAPESTSLFGRLNPFGGKSPAASPKAQRSNEAKPADVSTAKDASTATAQPAEAAHVQTEGVKSPATAQQPEGGSQAEGVKAPGSADVPVAALPSAGQAAAGVGGAGVVGLSRSQRVKAFFASIAALFGPKVSAGLIATAGAGTFALTEHPKVQQLLEKLNISSLDTEILVPLLSVLLTFGAVGYETPNQIAKFVALVTAFAKFYASNPVQLGIHKIPLIGNDLVSDEEVARINNNQVTVDEQSAKAWQTVGAISLFAALRSLQVPKFGKKEKVS